VALNGKVYTLGGADSRFNPLSEVVVYDPLTDTWAAAAPLPEPRHHLGAAELDGMIYVVGGYAGAAASGAAWVYDPAAGAWSAIASLPRPQAAHALVALEGRLYLIGGSTSISGVPQPVYVYDPSLDSWETLGAPLPTGREHLAAVAAQGKIFAIGGRVSAGLNLPTLEIYDPAVGSWTQGPDLPVATSGMTAAVLDSQIHVVGGENLANFSIVSAHQVLDLDTLTWSRYPGSPVARHGLASAALGGQWFVINGGPTADVSASAQLSIFTP
jgi:N-acetylneuraminic acid mutarotase